MNINPFWPWFIKFDIFLGWNGGGAFALYFCSSMPANAIVFEKMLMPWGWRGGIGTTGIDLLLTYVAGVKRYCRTYCYHRYRSWCRRRVHVYVRVCYYKKWKDRDIPIWLNRSSRHCITLNIDIKMWIVKGALSRYFKLFWASTELPLNWRKPENNTLQRSKDG